MTDEMLYSLDLILLLDNNTTEEIPRRLDYESEFQEVRDGWRW